MSAAKPHPDPLAVQRGNYARTPTGPLLFLLGRLASIPMQYLLITHSPLGSPPPSISLSPGPSAWTPSLDPVLVFVGMTVVLVAKQIIWLSCLSNEHMTVPFGVFGALAPALYEALSALVFCLAAWNPLWRVSFLYLGAQVHILAAAIELYAEVQRKAFKDGARNNGKLCSTGLWGIVRHPNFSMNIVYGVAYGFKAGGPLFKLLPLAMYARATSRRMRFRPRRRISRTSMASSGTSTAGLLGGSCALGCISMASHRLG